MKREKIITFKTLHLEAVQKIQECEGYEVQIAGRKMYVHETNEINPDTEDFNWGITDGETGAIFTRYKGNDTEKMVEVLERDIIGMPDKFEAVLKKVKKQITAYGIKLPINT